MKEKFSFESAMGWAFKAPRFGSFIWKYALSYGVIVTTFFGSLLYFGRGSLERLVTDVVALDDTDLDDPELAMRAFADAFSGVLPLIAFSFLGFWVIWSIFQAASMRRLVWSQGFSLGFGRDEINIMIVSCLFLCLNVLFMVIPVAIMWGAVSEAIAAELNGLTEEEIFEKIGWRIFGGMGAAFLTFPLLVFATTRLAPCFGLTMKEGKVRFFDAWNVSRNRFWPILGSYLLLAIGISIVVSVVDSVLQLTLFMPLTASIENLETVEEIEDVWTVLFSGPVLGAMMIYILLLQCLQAFQMHIVHAPAAFAARHDPRGSIVDDEKLSVFE